MPTIITIVEGRGEVPAVPLLIRRIAAAVAPTLVPRVPKPIRVKRGRFLKENELERYVDLAARQAGSDGRILIILDADDDCPAQQASEILERAASVRSDRRIQVVLAQREYEAWFLAAADSIAGHRELRSDTTAPTEPESVRDAKGWLTSRMPPGRTYKETRDQPALTVMFNLDQARRGARSFDKMWRTVVDLMQ